MVFGKINSKLIVVYIHSSNEKDVVSSESDIELLDMSSGAVLSETLGVIYT